MGSATITSKGRITIPLAVRERLGLRAGDRVDFVLQDDGSAVMVPATVRLADLGGLLPVPNTRLTVKEMNRAVRERRSGPRRT